MRPQDALPSWITNVLEIDKLSVSFQGTHEEYNIRREQARSIQHAKHSEYLKARDRQSDRKASSHNDSLVPIVELNNVNVTSLDGKKILSNVDWIIHKGEKWGLTALRPNGSGKTTLLAILVGDHPQAYSNPVRLFGHRRGEVGVSIWDIKDKIGFVSPEFHMHFTSRIARGHIGESEKPATTLFDAVCTGFRSGDNAALKLTQSQIDAASRIIKEFGMVDVKDYPFAKLSMGEQRVGLIMRALVKKPQLVIMDEPFQGIDEDTMTMLQAWMEREFENGQQGLVFVSHHQEEMPRFLEKFIKLADGKRVE
ncbi:hypothetical protein HK100_001780 [Physocladia obscura]|uniref:ABC transporter domain-containing protein n=1 Tax=Physocladia obscura TaxID=109957 RepID=A0AAD5T2B7_9FUNG|nr:hypothetical protein HK100_001780 [Physocladia obscura]